MERYVTRRSDIALGDVHDTWELVMVVDHEGDETEDIIAVLQTEPQIDKYCRDNGISAIKV